MVLSDVCRAVWDRRAISMSVLHENSQTIGDGALNRIPFTLLIRTRDELWDIHYRWAEFISPRLLHDSPGERDTDRSGRTRLAQIAVSRSGDCGTLETWYLRTSR